MGKLAGRCEGRENCKHRLLALDGGGIRGIMTLEVLNRMEKMLAEATGRGTAFRLCHFFDYIAGTSTGAIIAAGLARGMSAGELLDFYQLGDCCHETSCIRSHAFRYQTGQQGEPDRF